MVLWVRAWHLWNFRTSRLAPADIDVLKSVSLKIEPLQYIAIYYNGSIFNETDFRFKLLGELEKVGHFLVNKKLFWKLGKFGELNN